jgi:drug/metabolite transporter (DMT)-like permease
MLKGLVVVVVALYSVIFLHRRLYRHQVFGVVFVFVGVVIVGVGSVFMDTGDERNPALGAILIVAGQFIGGANWVIEEKFFGDIVVPPLQAVGIEGLSGLIYFAILLPIFYYIPCYNTNMCAGSGHVENVPYAFKQVGNNGLLLFFFIGNIFSVAIFNWSSLSVTKNASSLARSTIDTSRTIVVWSVDLIIGWEVFSYVQLVGFLLLAFGSFVYNEVLVLPWFGFKEAVALHREEMAKRKILVSEDTEEDMAYRLEEDGK